MERHEDLPLLTAVRSIILNKENKVLLTKRATGDFEAGKWCLPGGKPEENEDFIKAAKRETLEEIGVEIELKYYKGQINPDTSTGAKWLTQYFVGHLDEPPTQLQVEEVSEAIFFSQSELKELDIAFDHKDVLIQFFSNL